MCCAVFVYNEYDSIIVSVCFEQSSLLSHRIYVCTDFLPSHTTPDPLYLCLTIDLFDVLYDTISARHTFLFIIYCFPIKTRALDVIV
jgi:hypothetical protein